VSNIFINLDNRFKNSLLSNLQNKTVNLATLVANTIYIVLGLIIIVGATVVILVLNSGSKNTVSNAQLYSSSKDNFKIAFNGTPKLVNEASQKLASGGVYSVRFYDLVNKSQNFEQTVAVDTYSSDNFNTLSASQNQDLLKASLAAIATSYKSNISGTASVKFKGLNAITSEISPSSSKVQNSYVELFAKNNSVYAILDSGVSKAQFNNFVDSFSFLK
jgi:hypothetical protein